MLTLTRYSQRLVVPADDVQSADGDRPRRCIAALLKAYFSECTWTIKDLMKGSETSKAIVGFDYENKLVGTIELALAKEGKIWKIDNLAKPKFDKFALATEGAE